MYPDDVRDRKWKDDVCFGVRASTNELITNLYWVIPVVSLSAILNLIVKAPSEALHTLLYTVPPNYIVHNMLLPPLTL